MKKAYCRFERRRRGNPNASADASVTGSSSECAEAKKITSESCEQVNVGTAELVKKNSPDVPGVPHKAREKP